MAESAKTTLLALLLALKQLETPLTADEQTALKTAGQQLELDPDYWDYIKAGLMAVVEKNPSLDRLYQTAKAQLEVIEGNIPPELLPTEQEQETELLADENREPVTFGYCEGEPDRESDEILNVSISVFTKEDSTKTAKKLSFLKRIQAFLQKSNS
jgi:hypothetical protein